MANRRMVSLKIIDSARFIKMPQSTQNLYFHLVIRADDDGIVEAFNVMRMTGSTEDDLKVLVAKDFVTVLNDDLVTFVKDWLEHNLIRADRKIDSIYKDLLLQIIPDATIISHKQRADLKPKKQLDGQWTDNGRTMDGIGKVRLGKDSIGKDSNKRFIPPTVLEIFEYCKERNNKVNADYFHTYYQSKGWMVGSNKMKDWKAAVRTWENRDKEKQSTPDNNKKYCSCGLALFGGRCPECDKEAISV